ncbi:MAG: alpha/beta fold hydrolase [Saonia sp.]
MKWFLILGIPLLMLSGCKESPKQFGVDLSSKSSNSLENIESGFLEVPENRNIKNGKTIKLAYTVLKATGNNPKNDPILYLQGGPGGPTLVMESFWKNQELRSDRDIVLMDQRGTGDSNAICADLGTKFIEILAMDLTSAEEYTKILGITNECKKEAIEKEIDLSAYNSRENAADFESLRKKLGYKQWNLMGGSYGSRLGLTIMRDFPNSVRSSVLFGIFGPDSDLYTNFISSFSQSLLGTFEECRKDPDCNRQYPDLKTRFFDALKRLETDPIAFQYNGSEFVLNIQDVLLMAHQLLYRRNTIGFIPSFVIALENTDEEVLRQALRPTVITTNFINLAMYMSVMAYEELPFNGAPEFLQDLEKNPHFSTGPAFFNSDAQILENWHPFRAENNENEPVISDIPALIANGSLDPITPTDNALEVSKSLRKSYFLEFKREGHSLFNSCFFMICREFLDHPKKRPDLSCATKNPKIQWN